MDSKQDIKQQVMVKSPNTNDKVIAYFAKHKQYKFAQEFLAKVSCLRKKCNDQLFLRNMLQLLVPEYISCIFAVEAGKVNYHGRARYFGLYDSKIHGQESFFIDSLEKYDLREYCNENISYGEQTFLNYLFGCKLYDIDDEENTYISEPFETHKDAIEFFGEDTDFYLLSFVQIDVALRSIETSKDSTRLMLDLDKNDVWGTWHMIAEITKNVQKHGKMPLTLKKLQYLLDERKRIKDLEDKYYDENTEL